MAFVSKQRQSPQHKKRKALHHTPTKNYVKPYHPYLTVMLLIVGTGLIFNTLWTRNSQVLGAYSNFTSESLTHNTNLQRDKNDLPALSLDQELSSAAQRKADDMVRRDYWSHNTPDAKSFNTFIAESGYQYKTAGENLAYGFSSADQVINGWMSSPEHRANMLNNGYKNVGFGVSSSTDYLGKGPAVIIVAEYGEPTSATANISFNVDNQSSAVKGDKVEGGSAKVSRIEMITNGGTALSLAIVSAIAGAAIMLFLVRHGLLIHRMLSRGEKFIVKHPMLDVAFVFLATSGFILTRTGGLIH